MRYLGGQVLWTARPSSPGSRPAVPPASGDRNQMPETRLLVQFLTFRGQSWLFEVISYSFGIIFGQKTQEHVKLSKMLSGGKKRYFHLGHNIYIYICGISINIHNIIKTYMSRNKEHRGAAFGGAPNGAAVFGGRPIGSVFSVSVHLLFILWIFMYIPYIFLIYSFGLGPSPGWGPVRVAAHMGPYGPDFAYKIINFNEKP